MVTPALNFEGGSAKDVQTAVRYIEHAGSPERYPRQLIGYGKRFGWQLFFAEAYPTPMRLAFEMATHEETERQVMEGELAQLENDWKEAEELAAIADEMFLPQSVTNLLEKLKRG